MSARPLPLREKRGKRYKMFLHPDKVHRRITASIAPLHYESSIDSGIFDTEANLALQARDDDHVGGVSCTAANFHFRYQRTPARGGTLQDAPGFFQFGGRQGQHWLGMRPEQIGYFHGPSKQRVVVPRAPVFNEPTMTVNRRTLGKGWGEFVMNRGFRMEMAGLWESPGGGSVDWDIRGTAGLVHDFVIINQAFRTWFRNIEPLRTRAADTYFGVFFRLDWKDVPKGVARDDVTVRDELKFTDAQDRDLGAFGAPLAFIRNKPGRATPLSRVFRDNDGWWLFTGVRIDDMDANLLSGDLIIDPPITQESITANADDCSETGFGDTNLSGDSNGLFVGSNSYHIGLRFQTIPIAGTDTIASASLTLRQIDTDGATAPTVRVYCEDIDDAGAFTGGLSNSDVTGRTRTTAFTSFSNTRPGNGSDWNPTGLTDEVQEVIDRAGWATNNDIVFLIIGQSGNFTKFEDFNHANANEALFDASTAGGGNLAGSEAIAFGQTADLNADGELAGSESIAFGGTADLDGGGALAGSQSIAFGETAGLAGNGALAAATPIAFSETADLANAAAGAIRGTTAIAFGEGALLNADGALAAVVDIAFVPTGDLQGDGALAGSEAITFGETAALEGRTSLAGSEAIAFGEGAVLVGRGTLLGNEAIVFDETGDLTNATPGQLIGATSIVFGGQGRPVLDNVAGQWIIRARRRNRR